MCTFFFFKLCFFLNDELSADSVRRMLAYDLKCTFSYASKAISGRYMNDSVTNPPCTHSPRSVCPMQPPQSLLKLRRCVWKRSSQKPSHGCVKSTAWARKKSAPVSLPHITVSFPTTASLVVLLRFVRKKFQNESTVISLFKAIDLISMPKKERLYLSLKDRAGLSPASPFYSSRPRKCHIQVYIAFNK